MRKLFSVILIASALFAQTSTYPTVLDADSSLFVMADNVQSQLSVAMAAGDTTAFVTSSTGFLANMIVTVCDTVTSTGKCTVFEHMKVTAVPGSNTLTVTRGFDGTAARAHTSGKLITALFDRAHQNSLKSAVIAIETALGANLSHVPANPAVYSSTYNFSAQTCNASQVCTAGGSSGGSLIIGNTSLTMTPVPAGVNGTDLNHYLYVSGGTGTAEACLITGGAGTAGQTSGAIIINCANTHSGAFTVASATSGIQEALQSLVTAGVGGRVILPVGNVYTYAPVRVNGTGYYIQGQGMQATDIVFQDNASANALEFIAASLGSLNGVSNLSIFGPNGTVPTTKTAGAGIKLTNQAYFQVSSVYISAMPVGLTAKDSGYIVDYLETREMKPTTGIGIYNDGGNAFDTLIRHFTSDASAAYLAGIQIVSSGYIAIDRADIIHASYDLLVNPAAGQVVNSIEAIGTFFDTPYVNGILIAPSSTGSVSRSRFTDCWTSSSSGGAGVSIAPSGLLATVDGISFLHHHAFLNAQQGMVIGGTGISNIDIDASYFAGNSFGSSGTYPGLAIGADVSGIKVRNSVLAQYAGVSNSQTFGISIFPGVGTNLVITGNTLTPNTSAGIQDQATGTNKVILDNLGIDNIAPVSIASAASISLGLTDQPNYVITGTTAVDTITGVWLGRRVRLQWTNAAPAGVTAAGNIYVARAVSQYQSLDCVYDGTKWMCEGATPTPVYSAAGVLQGGGHVVRGTCTLGTNCAVTFSGSAAWTSSSSYFCSATDQTSAAAVKVVNTSSTVATFTGTGTDVLSYVCAGN